MAQDRRRISLRELSNNQRRDKRLNELPRVPRDSNSNGNVANRQDRHSRNSSGSNIDSGLNATRAQRQNPRLEQMDAPSAPRNERDAYRRRYANERYRKPKRSKAFVLVPIAIIIVLICGVGGFIIFQPIHATINGQEVELAAFTNYQTLRDDGILTAPSGNFIAVDDSVLEAGKGEPPIIMDGDNQITDFGTLVANGAVVTETKGPDIMEESETADKTIPWTWKINDGENFNFYNGPLHLLMQSGKDGLSQTLTGKISGKKVKNKVLEKMQPRVVNSYTTTLTSGEKVVALTYDDGPHPEGTPALLDTLAQNNVKATFFMLGTQVEEYPEIAKKVAEAGHQVASHSYSHDPQDYLNKLGKKATVNQLSKAQKLIEQATGVKTTIVRPPGGNMNGDTIKYAGDLATAFLGWSLDTEDFTRPGADKIAQRVLDGIKPGTITLMHDGGGERSQTIAATDTIIKQLKEQGYRFITIDELIELKKKEVS